MKTDRYARNDRVVDLEQLLPINIRNKWAPIRPNREELEYLAKLADKEDPNLYEESQILMDLINNTKVVVGEWE